MRMRRIFPVIFLMMAVIPAFAQEVGEGPVEVNYDRPVSYIIGGVTVEGNRAYGAEQIISLSGLRTVFWGYVMLFLVRAAVGLRYFCLLFFFFKQKTAYEL